MRQARRFLTDESAQDTVEYALMMLLLACAGLVILYAMGINVGSIFGKVGALIEHADKAVPGD